jgi:phosphohistidine phosphatase
VPVSIEPALYGADADELLEHLRELDSDVTTALLIGHNPAVHHLVLELTAGERVPGFAPATLAVLDLDVDGWAESASGTGRLLSLHIPDEQAR